MNGAIFIARKTIESDIWRLKPASWFKIWCYILMHIQHTNFKELKRGQGYFNFREIIRNKDIGCDITYSQVDHFMRWTKSANMLATTKATHGSLISVPNYNKYQSISTYKSDNKSDDSSEMKAKQKRNESDNINKNDKNDKNVNNTNVLLKTDVSLNTLINLFKGVNPNYDRLFANKTERDALQRQVDKFSYKRIENLLNQLPEITSRPFAPRITKPTELENKMGQLLIFLKGSNKSKIAVFGGGKL